MRKLLLLLALVPFVARSQPTQPIEATPTQVSAGVLHYPFVVTPFGLGGSSAGGAGGLNVLENGVLGGTNDDTAVLQGLFNKGGPLFFPATNYTVSGLNLTNNTQLWGYGATISLLSGVRSNAVFTTYANNTNVAIFGFTLSGGFLFTNSTDAGFGQGITNRMGLNLYNDGTGIHIQDLVIYGFDKGINLYADQNSTIVYQKPAPFISSCELESNYFGFYANTTNINNAVEYITPIQLLVHDNTIGLFIGGGNIGFLGCDISDNWEGVYVDGTGANAAHGFVNDCKINHNAGPLNNGHGFVVANITTANLFTFENNQIIADNDNLITNAQGVRIIGNMMNEGIICGAFGVSGSSRGPNFVIDNCYTGNWGVQGGGGLFCGDWSVSFVPDQTTNLIHWGNYSVNVQGDHDPYLSSPFWTNTVNTAGSTNPVILLSGGLNSSSTNTLAVTSGGITNNTTVNYIVAITAGTAMAMKDQNGSQFFTPILGSSYPLKPGWRLTGTAVTATCIQYP